MTLLVTSIMADRPDAALAAAEDALVRGADAVELRLDRWSGEPSEWPAVAPVLASRSWIATCRSADEGGEFQGDLRQRVARLLMVAARGDGFVDFEFADWQRSANIRQKILLAATSRGAETVDDSRLILSSHDFAGRPAKPSGLLDAMSEEQDAAAIKLAWQAESVVDNLEAFDLMRQAIVPAIVICMGPAGLPSRVLAAKFGAFATYCSTGAGEETAPGQATLDEMVNTYRWRSIGPDTRVFGVIGDPVAHSMSPLLFNECFERAGIDAVYLPLLVAGGGDELDRFLSACLRRSWLDLGGFSVTVPHKEAACRLADEVEPLAGRIGAVNTLVPRNNTLAAYNTDYVGALTAITETLDCRREELAGKRAEVIGAGGVARAVVAGLCDCGCAVTIFNRDAARAEQLAGEFGCRSEAWDRRVEVTGADLIVNCTSVGMWPAVEDSPVPPERLGDRPVVFDTVYNPVRTRLLQEAEAAGCRTIDGVSMFVNQAAEQFRLWTGRQVDRSFMRATVEKHLLGEQGTA